MNFILSSLTPSTEQLHELRAGKVPGRLSKREIELLRKSKKEISEVCRKTFEALNLDSAKQSVSTLTEKP